MGLKLPKIKFPKINIRIKPIDVIAPGTGVAVDVLGGKKPRDAAKDYVDRKVGAAKDAVGVVADIENRLQQEVRSLVEKVGGDEARKVFEDITRIGRPMDAATGEAYLGALQAFIRTGDLDHLNPLVVAIAGELQSARDTYWNAARRLPAAVIDAMPAAVRRYAGTAKYIDVSETAGLSLPAIATGHLEKVRAIVAIDLIFFRGVPGTESTGDLHLWAHEIFHVKQYAELGLPGFVEAYVGQEIGFRPAGDRGNEIEVEADLFACRHFWIPNPTYLPGPCPHQQ